MRTFCFHFPKQNSEIDIPSRGPPPAKPPMVVVGDAHPNTMENQGLNNTSSAWLSITAKTRNPGCSRKSQNAVSRSDIVFCVFTLMQCCAHSKTTNRLKQLYPHEGEVSPQNQVFRRKTENAVSRSDIVFCVFTPMQVTLPKTTKTTKTPICRHA